MGQRTRATPLTSESTGAAISRFGNNPGYEKSKVHFDSHAESSLHGIKTDYPESFNGRSRAPITTTIANGSDD